MAVHQTCRPRAIQTARDLERLGSVLVADAALADASPQGDSATIAVVAL